MAAWTETDLIKHYDTAKIVWDYFKLKGLSNEACAAILGNIETESHFEVSAIEAGNNNEGHGLVQWSYTRRENLKTYAESQQKPWDQLDVQLDFIWDELNHTHKGALNILNTATDVSSATIGFENEYERASVKKLDERVFYAEYWYNHFKDTDITVDNNGALGSSASQATQEEENEESFYKYFKTGLLNIPEKESAMMMDELIKVDSLRRIDPPYKEDNIKYGHRFNSTIYSLSLGDCTFTIPPQAISIVSESNSQELITLRQENTQKVKSGYSKRTISIELVFHGLNQINGYQVQGPEEGHYYVDGLRQLLAQFKCTPFLPVENHTINNTYNIHTVALQSIICSTVEGFPDMMIANLTLQEVDLSPYIEINTAFFGELIDWDLFRFYYQRQLTEKHEYGKLQSIPVNKALNKFKISVLNDSIFDKEIVYETDKDSSIEYTMDYDTGNKTYYDEKYNLKGKKANFSFYDIALDRKVVYTDNNGYHVEDPSEAHPSNFNTYLDSETDGVYITSFQCGYSNILTNIQMAEHLHPTVQYMGGMDTMFNITLETRNSSVVTALEKCNIMNNMITKNNKDCTTLGFVKLESELTELFGSKFVIMDSVTTHTVPDFPGLFICQINCVSFDIYQKEGEGIHGLSPFDGTDTLNGKGTKENAITQSLDGLAEKVKQDTCVEHKMRVTCELYPDLKLPTYKEVDEVITKIIKFRRKHNLNEYPINRYPRTPQRMLHGISKITNLQVDINGFVTNVPDVIDNSEWYEGYVDPDFYVFYPDTYKNMLDATKESREELGLNYDKSIPEAKTITSVAIKTTNDITTDSSISYYDKTFSQGTTELQMKFISLARQKIGKPYSNDNSGHFLRIGPNAYDCSGLIGKCLYEMGILKSAFITTSGIGTLIESGVLKEKYKITNVNNIDVLIAHAEPGDLLHIYNTERNTSMGHIAIYIGDGKIIHASGQGVCEQKVYKGFLRVLEIPALRKGNPYVYQEVENFAKVYVNINASKGDNGNEIKQLQNLLNEINNAGLEIDGSFGALTEKAVKDFQVKYGLQETGIVDSETSIKLTEAANEKISKFKAKTTISNGSDASYIKEEELEAIAKTIANIQLGSPYMTQKALAQLIYDMFTDTKAKYGTLSNILNSSIFKGQYPKKLPAHSTALNAAKAIFCDGEKVCLTQLVSYLGIDSGNNNYDNLDEVYKRVEGVGGSYTFWTNEKPSLNKKYTLIDNNTDTASISSEVIKEETEIIIPVDEIDEEFVKLFGKPVLIKASEMEKDGGWIKGICTGKGLQNQESRYKDNYNTTIQTLMTSFVNQCEYSGKGRLVKAFPTYLFSIVDEDGNWLDGKKLWANYYMLRSLVEIQVANYNDSPISTATIIVTNSYGNLDTLPPNAFYYSPANDSEYTNFAQTLYKWFGMLPGFGPKLTQTLVDQKNIIYDSMVIRAGSRMHLRMGYGSDPLSLPIVMNGYISDLQVGDITQFVCVSDGVELTNSIISDNPTDVNGIFEDQEPSNICIDLLAARQLWLNRVNRKWGEPNQYGIEHFGLYFSEHIDFDDWKTKIVEYNNSNNIEIGDNLGANILETTVNSNFGIEPITEAAASIAIDTAEIALTAIKEIGDGVFKGWKTVQYDLIKNIYRTSYDGSIAMYTPFLGMIDKETNICFNKYNKTPWDAIQMSIMNAPEYIGMPMYHQFESRLFLGLPLFLAKYRYDLINGELYEEAKTFAQCHFVDSLTEIIDNQMITTSRDVFTNAIVMYTLGKSPQASPTLYSDKTISFSQQSTKIFDSSVTQNIIGPDKLWQFLGMEFGEMQACRVGTSQLLWNWQKAYQGDLLLIGDAGIEPDDYIYLNDRYNDITGLCTARTVIHSLSARTGFVTTITPGMIGTSTEQRAQTITQLTNIISIGSSFSYYANLKKIIKDNADKVAEWYNNCKNWAKALEEGEAYFKLGLLSFGTYEVTKDVLNLRKMIKGIEFTESLTEIKKISTVLRTSIDTYKDLKKMQATFKIVKAANAGLKVANTSFKALFTTTGATGGTVAGPLGTLGGAAIGFAVGLLFDTVLNAVIDFFRWNNVLVLLPLMHKNNPYAPILSGEKLLLTGSSNVSSDTIATEVAGAPQEEGDYGEAFNMSDQNNLIDPND